MKLKTLRRTVLLLVLGISLCTMQLAAQAQSLPLITYTVNTLADLYDTAPNEICAGWVGPNPEDFGDCSLRAAITEAGYIHIQPKYVNIKLPPGTYQLTQKDPPFVGAPDIHYGDLDLPDFPEGQIPNKVVIQGTGGPDNPSIIDANFIDRVLELGEYRNLTLLNIVIQNGKQTGTNLWNSRGGGIYQRANSSLFLEDVLLKDNQSTCTALDCGAAGAAIYSVGKELTMFDTEIVGNRSDVDSAISYWYAPGRLLIQNSTIHRNISNRVTIAGRGYLFLVNSTIANNFESTPDGDRIGTIFWTSKAWIQNSTVISNNPVTNVRVTESLTIRNSILMNAVSPQPVGFTNCSGTPDVGPLAITSMGGNIFSEDSCDPNPAKRDLVTSIDRVLLGKLADYGGFTPTMALLEGSPAIDRVMGKCIVTRYVSGLFEDNLETDQRGRPRADAFCDAGAFEGDGGWVPTFLPVVIR